MNWPLRMHKLADQKPRCDKQVLGFKKRILDGACLTEPKHTDSQRQYLPNTDWGAGDWQYSNYESLRPRTTSQERVGERMLLHVLPDIHLQRAGRWIRHLHPENSFHVQAQ